MRLTLETIRSTIFRAAFSLGLIAALGACGSGADGTPALASTGNAAREAGTGPAADYPVILGEPYSVDGTLYTPVDTMSYDEVGYAAADMSGGTGVTAAHKTLPLPSYVEITSLVTGKTLVARGERRGPMTSERLVALSPQAQTQLGSEEGAPVRVRRVNPPEIERAKLRRGEAAAERMETPQSLVSVLKRKLPERGSVDLAAVPAPVEAPAEILAGPVAVEVPPSVAANLLAPPESGETLPPVVAPEDTAAEPVSRPQEPSLAGKFVVQAATFSSKAGAETTASSLGGFVEPSGKYFRVRVGPFPSRGQADAALAKVRAAGYSDARVTTAG
ncbi:MAG: SPOR domain-containing protein [Allopontixanthobacter sediminis]